MNVSIFTFWFTFYLESYFIQNVFWWVVVWRENALFTIVWILFIMQISLVIIKENYPWIIVNRVRYQGKRLKLFRVCIQMRLWKIDISVYCRKSCLIFFFLLTNLIINLHKYITNTFVHIQKRSCLSLLILDFIYVWDEHRV